MDQNKKQRKRNNKSKQKKNVAKIVVKNQVKKVNKKKNVGKKNNDKSHLVVESRLATGVAAVDSIVATADSDSFLQAPLGLVSLAFTLGFEETLGYDAYAAYLAIYDDIVATSNATFDSCKQKRLTYVDEIINSLAPKSIPMGNGQASYSWKDIPVAPTHTVQVNGYTYKLPNTSPNDQSKMQNYSALLNIVGAYNQKKEVIVRDRQEKTIYSTDVSAYARNSPYHGNVYSSVEGEVWFKSGILASFSDFVPSENRSSRYLRTASTNSNLAFSYGFLTGTTIKHYENKFPVRTKILDFAEFVYYCLYWYAGLCEKFMAQHADANPADLILQFDFQTFVIIARQQLLCLFAEEQCAMQTVRPLDVTNGPIPMLCGENCFPQRVSTPMILPNVLVENLRALKKRVMTYDTKFQNSGKNVIDEIPVWCVYPENEWTAVSFKAGNEQISVLFGTPILTSDLVDGSSGVNFVNFNDPSVQANVLIWNKAVTSLQEYSVPLENLGGGSRACFLPYTRYYTSIQSEKINERTLKFLPKDSYKIEKTKQGDRIIAPAGSSLATFAVLNMTSMEAMSQSFVEIASRLILPSYFLDTTAAGVSVSQIQTEYGEPFKLMYMPEADFPSRLNQIQIAAYQLAPGEAASKTDALSNFIDQMNVESKGGFLGDLFNTVGNVANTIGI